MTETPSQTERSEQTTTQTETSTQNSFSASPVSSPNVHERKPWLFKPGQCANPGGRPKNVFDLQLRCKQEGAKVFEIILGWALSSDFRASLPACRMILATGFAKFEKATEEMGTVPPGFENLSVAERIEVLKQRRAELKAAETGAAQSAAQPVATQTAKASAAPPVVPAPIPIIVSPAPAARSEIINTPVPAAASIILSKGETKQRTQGKRKARK